MEKRKQHFAKNYCNPFLFLPRGDIMDRNNIEKIARTPEDRLLLAKLWDKINTGIRKNIPANTCFLSPRELEMTRYLFGDLPGLHAFGGYNDAERKMLIYLPDYLNYGVVFAKIRYIKFAPSLFHLLGSDHVAHRADVGAEEGGDVVFFQNIVKEVVVPDHVSLAVQQSDGHDGCSGSG